jgi:ATP-binding cassette subfamily B protein AbcA/BmrA
MKKFDGIRNTFRIMTWSWGFIRPWRKTFIICALLGMMQNAWMSVTSAYLIGQTTLHAATGNYRAMFGTVGLVAVIALAGIIVITATNYHSSKINIRGTVEILKALFEFMILVLWPVTSWACFKNHMSGPLPE